MWTTIKITNKAIPGWLLSFVNCDVQYLGNNIFVCKCPKPTQFSLNETTTRSISTQQVAKNPPTETNNFIGQSCLLVLVVVIAVIIVACYSCRKRKKANSSNFEKNVVGRDPCC